MNPGSVDARRDGAGAEVAIVDTDRRSVRFDGVPYAKSAVEARARALGYRRGLAAAVAAELRRAVERRTRAAARRLWRLRMRAAGRVDGR